MKSMPISAFHENYRFIEDVPGDAPVGCGNPLYAMRDDLLTFDSAGAASVFLVYIDRIVKLHAEFRLHEVQFEYSKVQNSSCECTQNGAMVIAILFVVFRSYVTCFHSCRHAEMLIRFVLVCTQRYRGTA